jgi:hypothetical protein
MKTKNNQIRVRIANKYWIYTKTNREWKVIQNKANIHRKHNNTKIGSRKQNPRSEKSVNDFCYTWREIEEKKRKRCLDFRWRKKDEWSRKESREWSFLSLEIEEKVFREREREWKVERCGGKEAQYAMNCASYKDVVGPSNWPLCPYRHYYLLLFYISYPSLLSFYSK